MRNIAALYRLLAERAAMPFAWGSDANDCVSFAAAAVEVQTGRRIDFGHEWTTALGAARVLDRMGGIDVAVDTQLRRVSLAMARRGDVAAMPSRPGGNDLLLAIVEGDTLVGPGPKGLERMPRSAMTIAWSAE